MTKTKKKHATKIEWTHAPGYKGETWNPLIALRSGPKGTKIRGWYCEKVSAECDRCYAESMNIWQGTHLKYDADTRGSVSLELHEPTLIKPYQWTKPRMVFVCSMTDLHGRWVENFDLMKIYTTMGGNDKHIFQCLTKRPSAMATFMKGMREQLNFPFENVWCGTSVGIRKAIPRIKQLCGVKAHVKFISFEPLLEQLDGVGLSLALRQLIDTVDSPRHVWAILGGESGQSARPCQIAWIRDIAHSCRQLGVPVFVKQLGKHPMTDHNGAYFIEDRKGGDWDEWPDEMRIREWPAPIKGGES